MHPRRTSLVVSGLSDKFYRNVSITIFGSHLLAKSIALLSSALDQWVVLLACKDEFKQLLKLVVEVGGSGLHTAILARERRTVNRKE
jgi:hypothetical protein